MSLHPVTLRVSTRLPRAHKTLRAPGHIPCTARAAARLRIRAWPGLPSDHPGAELYPLLCTAALPRLQGLSSNGPARVVTPRPLWVRALFGANHAFHAVGGHSDPARAVDGAAGEDALLLAQGLLQPHPVCPGQGLAEGSPGVGTALPWPFGRALGLTFQALARCLPSSTVPGSWGGGSTFWLLHKARLGGSFHFPLFSSPCRAAVLCVKSNFRKALLVLLLALGGCTGRPSQDVAAKGMFAMELPSSMTVQRGLLWISEKQPF